jgi:hypothetical protein
VSLVAEPHGLAVHNDRFGASGIGPRPSLIIRQTRPSPPPTRRSSFPSAFQLGQSRDRMAAKRQEGLAVGGEFHR